MRYGLPVSRRLNVIRTFFHANAPTQSQAPNGDASVKEPACAATLSAEAPLPGLPDVAAARETPVQTILILLAAIPLRRQKKFGVYRRARAHLNTTTAAHDSARARGSCCARQNRHERSRAPQSQDAPKIPGRLEPQADSQRAIDCRALVEPSGAGAN